MSFTYSKFVLKMVLFLVNINLFSLSISIVRLMIVFDDKKSLSRDSGGTSSITNL